MVPWLNWIEQPPPKGQVTGSNPVGIAIFSCLMHVALDVDIASCNLLLNSVCFVPWMGRIFPLKRV